jgi:D-alanine-D-alanine ligase
VATGFYVYSTYGSQQIFKKSEMKVLVLAGGISKERKVSLVSGARIAQFLKLADHEVIVRDISPTDLSALELDVDVVFPVTHGKWGESGELQRILEERNLMFVGSGSIASKVGMNKVQTKLIWIGEGLPTPRYEIITGRHFVVPFLPCVVKPADEGSSIGVSVCRTTEEATFEISNTVSTYGSALVEEFINGHELTFSILNGKVLAPIRVKSKNDILDEESKYTPGGCEHEFDDELEKYSHLAKRAFDVVGARDYARVDMMLDRQGNPYLLEINTLPGFTEQSFFPDSALHSGLALSSVVDSLVRAAKARQNGEVQMSWHHSIPVGEKKCIEELYVSSFVSSYESQGIFSSSQERTRFLQHSADEMISSVSSKECEILLAKIQGNIVGLATVQRYRDGSCYLGQFAVKRGLTRRGIGTAMVKEIQFSSARSVLLLCRKENKIAELFYLKLGAKKTGFHLEGYDPVLYQGLEF